ncbi:ribbon-helix-helix domain-containing protein [Candidatus Woesearchaeota archaeon]|nr:ribbon-helix-helix domain-containing protein [Candidatus Woesearchaeota archaeon]
MPTITLSVPEELKKRMDENKFMNWSEIAREAIKKQLERVEMMKDLEKIENIVKKSKLTEKDAIQIGRQINRSANKQLIDEINNRRKHTTGSTNKK